MNRVFGMSSLIISCDKCFELEVIVFKKLIIRLKSLLIPLTKMIVINLFWLANKLIAFLESIPNSLVAHSIRNSSVDVVSNKYSYILDYVSDLLTFRLLCNYFLKLLYSKFCFASLISLNSNCYNFPFFKLLNSI